VRADEERRAVAAAHQRLGGAAEHHGRDAAVTVCRHAHERIGEIPSHVEDDLRRLPVQDHWTLHRVAGGSPGAAKGGGSTTAKDYGHRIRPGRRPAFLKLDFQPGECAQIDWGEFGTVTVGNTRRRLSFFVMVLCYSRRMYLEFTVSQEMEFFLACHENAFAAFGGCPRRIMVDNLKSAVLQRLVGGLDEIASIQVDWALYGPKLAQVALTVGADDLDAVSAIDDESEGRRRAPLEEVRRNILAAALVPALRDRPYRRTG